MKIFRTKNKLLHEWLQPWDIASMQKKIDLLVKLDNPDRCADFASEAYVRGYFYKELDWTQLRKVALRATHMKNVWDYARLAAVAPHLEQQDFAILKKLETMTGKELTHYYGGETINLYLSNINCPTTKGLTKVLLEYIEEQHSCNTSLTMQIMKKVKTKEEVSSLQKCIQSECAYCNKQFQKNYSNGMETFFKMLYEVPNIDPNLALDFIAYEAGNQFNLIEDTLCILTSNDPMKDYKVNNLPKQVTPEQIEMLKACRHRNLKNFLIVRNLDNFILSENTSYENTLLYLDGATKEMKDYELYKFEEKLNNSHSQQIVADFSKIVKNPNDEVLSR